MANLVKRMLRQDAILWTYAGEDRFGRKTYEEPRQIKCRWEEKTEQFLDRTGNTQISRAQVYVPEKIPELSVLWQGTFATVVVANDEDGVPDPFVNPGAYEVRQYGEQPNFKARPPSKFLRWVYLLILCSTVPLCQFVKGGDGFEGTKVSIKSLL